MYADVPKVQVVSRADIVMSLDPCLQSFESAGGSSFLVSTLSRKWGLDRGCHIGYVLVEKVLRILLEEDLSCLQGTKL
jgi:hypothetical protein